MTARSAGVWLLPLLLGACGSQNDAINIDLEGGSASSGPAGIYEATLSSSTENRQAEWRFVLAPRRPMGEAPSIVGYAADNPQRVMVGTYERGAGNSLTGALRFYSVLEVEIPVLDDDGEATDETETVLRRRVQPLSIVGDFRAGETLDFLFSGQSPEGEMDFGDGRVSGTYAERLSERPSGQSVLAGGWRNVDEFGSTVVSFTIGDDTGIAGMAPDPVSGQQCRYDGRFAVINRRFNVYEISFDQSQCGGDPEADEPPPLRVMRGLAFLDDFRLAEGAEDARASELVFIMGSAPLPEDGSAEARVFELDRQTGL